MSAMHSDNGKPGVQYLPPAALLDVAAAFTYGEKKYGAYNWRQGMPWSKLYASTVRHLLQWFTGEDINTESGLPHLAHAAANILMVMDYAKHRLGSDDREFRGKPTPAPATTQAAQAPPYSDSELD